VANEMTISEASKRKCPYVESGREDAYCATYLHIAGTGHGSAAIEYCKLCAATADLRNHLAEAHNMAYLCQDDSLNRSAKYLSDNPQIDMLQSHAITTNGDDMTIIIMRGKQEHAAPLREAKKQLAYAQEEIERLREKLNAVATSAAAFVHESAKMAESDERFPRLDTVLAALNAIREAMDGAGDDHLLPEERAITELADGAGGEG